MKIFSSRFEQNQAGEVSAFLKLCERLSSQMKFREISSNWGTNIHCREGLLVLAKPKSRSTPASSPPTKHQRLVVHSTATAKPKLPFTTRPSATTKSSNPKLARTPLMQAPMDTKAAQATGKATAQSHGRRAFTVLRAARSKLLRIR